KLGKQPAALRDIADACLWHLVSRKARQLHPILGDLAGADTYKAHDRPKCRCLSGSVPSQKAVHLAAADLDRETVQSLHITVRAVDPVHEKSGAHRTLPRYARCTAGLARISSRVPSARTRPWSMTVIRSASA